MRSLHVAAILGFAVLTLAGCSALPSFLGGSKNTIEALIDAHSVGTYKATITKNDVVILQKTYTCVPTEATLPKCEEVKIVSVPETPSVK